MSVELTLGCSHFNNEHDAMRSDIDVWMTLPLVGYQDAGDDAGYLLELRDAPCGSTLARQLRCGERSRVVLLGRDTDRNCARAIGLRGQADLARDAGLLDMADHFARLAETSLLASWDWACTVHDYKRTMHQGEGI